jgi:hypothetical protein
MRHHRLLAVLLLLLAITASCGADEPAAVDTTRQPSDTTTTNPPADDPIRAVFVDPDDPAHVYVSADCVRVPAPDAPSTVEVAEASDRVVLSIGTPVLEPPCNPVRLEVRLQAPLGDRTVVNASGSELPVDTYMPPDPSRLVQAECTDDAARAVVANDVDGGLRSELLGCLDGWMAVRTSTDACPATGEAPAEGCIGNIHTVYWREVAGHWTLTGFDDCDSIRRQYPGPPPSLCHQE